MKKKSIIAFELLNKEFQTITNQECIETKSQFFSWHVCQHKSSLMFFCLMVFLMHSLLSSKAFSQDLDTTLKYYADRQGFMFTMPKGFKGVENGGVIRCWDMKLPSEKYYTMINKKKDVKVSIGGFWFELPKGKDSLAWMQYYEKNYLVIAKNIADTTNGAKIRFYDADYLKQFNADDGGEYCRKCYRGEEEQFKNMRVVFFSNTNRGRDTRAGTGHIEIVYTYKDSAKNRITEIMLMTRNMIKFYN